MTRIAFCSDVHLGNHKRHSGDIIAGLNLRCREGLDVLARAIQKAEEERCSAFVVSGDLFDTCKPEPQLIAEVQRIFNSTDMQVILLLGNHEQNSTQPGDHALAPLRDQACVVDKPRAVDIDSVRLALVPFMPVKAHEYINAKAIQGLGQGHSGQLLASAHVGCSDADTPAFLTGSHDSMGELQLRAVLKEAGTHAAFIGNWHNHQYFHGDPPIYQTGALVPTGWDNPGFDYGMVAIYDSDERGVRTVEIGGPRFLSVESPEAIEQACVAGRNRKARLYLRGLVQPSEALATQAVLDEARKEGLIVSGEVVVDVKQAREQAAMAAHITRASNSFDEAVATYVKEMPLDTNVSRENVLIRLKGYLK